MKLLKFNVRTGLVTLILFGSFFSVMTLSPIVSSARNAAMGGFTCGWLWALFAALMQGDAVLRTNYIRVRKSFSTRIETIPYRELDHIEIRGTTNWSRIVFHTMENQSFSVFLGTARLCAWGQLDYMIDRLNESIAKHNNPQDLEPRGGPVPKG